MVSSYKLLIFIALLSVLLASIANGDILDPVYDRICEEVECGKGTCKANITHRPFGYVCECDDGWSRTKNFDDDADEDLPFLPCVVPNCTMNYGTCQPAPPPVPAKEVPLNISFFDPCYWIYCGEGTCTKNETYTHTCKCNPGFYNLLNRSYFPCYSDCTIGSDCSSLGIKVAKSESTSNSSVGGGSSQGSSILPGKYDWMIILLISMFALSWK